MADKAGERISLTVNLSAEATAIIRGIREDTGVPNVEAMTRLLEWFAAMPRKFRTAVLTKDVEGRDELLVEWLRAHLAAKAIKENVGDVGDDFDANLAAVRHMLNVMHANFESMKDAAQQKRRPGKKG